MNRLGKAEGIVAIGALTLTAGIVLVYLEKMDGMALAALAGAFFSSSAIAAFRDFKKGS